MFRMKRAEVDISRRLKGMSQTLQTDCDSYLSCWSSLGIGVGSGKTKLDQHRRLACQKAVVSTNHTVCYLLHSALVSDQHKQSILKIENRTK